LVLDHPSTPSSVFASPALPRIVFVLGKGGVGRSTLSAALGLLCAQRGERTLIMQWAVADAIGPWFAAAPAGATPTEIAPRLRVANFALDEALRAYFVDHLHLGLIYRRIVQARAVTRMIEVAPGLAEMFFLGQLWWLITLAEREAGVGVDRVIVDAPATGHAASLLDIPSLASTMATTSLLSVETRRVMDMLADPRRTGAVVVTLPEPLVADETLELIPRVTSRLGRPPIGLVVNRSANTIVGDDERPPWLDLLAEQLSEPSRRAMAALHEELRGRVVMEAELRRRVACSTLSFAELPGRRPIEVVRAASRMLEAA
jgi:anion-transporting  ArsA/GET3 family ATPase